MRTESDKNIYVKDTGKYGMSIFAARDFNRDEIVFTICGPITKNPSVYTVPIDFDLYIDPLPSDSFGKILCHSCEPSCGIKNRTQIVAMRDLKKGDEITIDYGTIVSRYGDDILAQDITCRCGSKNCRGEFGSYEKLSDGLKEKYKGYISDYLLEA